MAERPLNKTGRPSKKQFSKSDIPGRKGDEERLLLSSFYPSLRVFTGGNASNRNPKAEAEDSLLELLQTHTWSRGAVKPAEHFPYCLHNIGI